ncbi:MAG: hypothetical protein JST82_07590 [Bacteroidetes bacterium]|nr:hypothetical protein [Bacteroidota bacterium]
MKKVLLLSFCFAPIIAFCKGDLQGNWREVSRMNGKSYVTYTDTIFIEFLKNNEYVWQKSGGFIYRGTFKNEAGALDMGMRYFNIISQDNNTLVLKDDAGTYEFRRYTPAVNSPQAKRQEVYAPVNSVQQMAGHWSVFKRTNATKVNDIDYTRQLKWVDFYNAPQDGKWGAFCAQRDADQAPSWFVENYSNQTVYLNGKDRRQFHVIKCENNELIMEENGTTYYFKQFK